MAKKWVNVAATFLFLAGSATAEKYNPHDEWLEDYNVQSLLGAVWFDKLEFEVDDSQTPHEADLSVLPQLGAAWSTLPRGEQLQVGLEATFLIGFRTDKINYLYVGGGGLYVELSTSLWTFDLAGGAYVNLFLDKNQTVRVYAAGGPLLAYADYDADKEFSDNTTPDEDLGESAFGAGVYARTGIEFRVYEQGMLGMGARGSWTSLDLSDVGGSAELSGIAAFVTFTAGFSSAELQNV